MNRIVQKSTFYVTTSLKISVFKLVAGGSATVAPLLTYSGATAALLEIVCRLVWRG